MLYSLQRKKSTATYDAAVEIPTLNYMEQNWL